MADGTPDDDSGSGGPFSDRFDETADDGGGDGPDDDQVAEILDELTDEDAELDEPGVDDADDGDGDDDEPSPAEDFGTYAGILVAAVVVGSLFVGPTRVFDVVLSADGLVPLQTRDSGNAPFVVSAVSTLFVGLFAGFAYPFTDRPVEKDVSKWKGLIPVPGDDDYRSSMAIGLVLPSFAVFAILAVVLALVPVGSALLAGEIVTATIYFVVLAVVAAIALGASIVIIALFLIASVYFLVPAFVGVFLGTFVGELAAS